MLASKSVGTADTTLFSAAKSTAVTLIVLTNVGESTDKITIHAVKSGETPGTVNQILRNHLISANRTFLFNLEKFILDAGDSIVAVSELGVISATVSGMILE
jgi:hypothetical protein